MRLALRRIGARDAAMAAVGRWPPHRPRRRSVCLHDAPDLRRPARLGLRDGFTDRARLNNRLGHEHDPITANGRCSRAARRSCSRGARRCCLCGALRCCSCGASPSPTRSRRCLGALRPSAASRSRTRRGGARGRGGQGGRGYRRCSGATWPARCSSRFRLRLRRFGLRLRGRARFDGGTGAQACSVSL